MVCVSEPLQDYVGTLHASGEAAAVALQKRNLELWQAGLSEAPGGGSHFPIEDYPSLGSLLSLLWADSIQNTLQAQLVPKADRPFAIELCVGCSVGCWFCCFSAKQLSAVPSFADHESLFTEVLEVMGEKYGQRASQGFLYWATDPLDNPDYLKFAQRFVRTLGRFPETTTALAVQNVGQLRELLDLARRTLGRVRLSVTSKRQLEALHNSFSALDLLDVELILQFKGTPYSRTISGRFRDAIKRNPRLLHRELHQEDAFGRKTTVNPRLKFDTQSEQVIFDAGSCACVAGPLLNLYSHSCSIVRPVNADDLHPLGYVVERSTTFASARDLKAFLDG